MSVRIRMYRAGLGDCFLLSFPREGDADFNMLIDCGVHSRSSDAVDKLRRAAEHIEQTLPRNGDGMARLDLLVATHEHWDHLSGFAQARDVFDRIAVDHVWVPWTEDDRHPLARRLREERAARLQALAAANHQLQALAADEDSEATELRNRLQTALAFFGFESAPDGMGVGGTARTSDAYRYAMTRGEVRYCRPDDRYITFPQLPGVRFFVLGPPEDEVLLKKDQGNAETYHGNTRLNADLAFHSALQPDCRFYPASPEDSERQARSQPFDAMYRREIGNDSDCGFFAKEYVNGKPWQKIDHDWLQYAEQLALNLDSDTNNTSLALAIELIDSGKVMLFPADAQVGNWLSWTKCKWNVPGRSEVRIRDLLRRTVLYKVAHHGSHNATLRAEGLELMESPDLVAMISTDEAYAAKQGRSGWKMPYQPLYERLHQRTKGRILRADRDWPRGAVARPEGITDREWRDFLNACTPDDAFIEYRIAN